VTCRSQAQGRHIHHAACGLLSQHVYRSRYNEPTVKPLYADNQRRSALWDSRSGTEHVSIAAPWRRVVCAIPLFAPKMYLISEQERAYRWRVVTRPPEHLGWCITIQWRSSLRHYVSIKAMHDMCLRVCHYIVTDRYVAFRQISHCILGKRGNKNSGPTLRSRG
jgi:hypothetical protein